MEGMGEKQQGETTEGPQYFPLAGWNRTEGSEARLVRGVCLVCLVCLVFLVEGD